jgi:general secretion pathway protein H
MLDRLQLERVESRRSQRGLTLVEVLIVVALIGVLSGTVIAGSGALEASRLRSAATLMVAGVRLGITRASTSGKPTRLVFDLESEQVMLEEANTSVLVREKTKGDDSSAGAEPATELEKKARAESEKILDGPRAPRASFKPVKEFSETPEGRNLGSGIEFISVQTDHDDEPRTSGRAYLYFWPGGVTERASIQLKRKGADEGLTVTVSPLTGRAKIERGRVELKPAKTDDEFSEREE